jgi:hypothetical protein
LLHNRVGKHHTGAETRAAASDPWAVVEHDARASCERLGHFLPTAHVPAEAGLKDNHRPGVPKPLKRDFDLPDTQPAHVTMPTSCNASANPL